MAKNGILNVDEQDAFEGLLDHPGYRPLLKVIEQLVNDQEQQVLKLNVADGVDGLVYAKLRAEGARRLLNNISELKKLHRAARK